jgi:hypothetical protein
VYVHRAPVRSRNFDFAWILVYNPELHPRPLSKQSFYFFARISAAVLDGDNTSITNFPVEFGGIRPLGLTPTARVA